MEGHTDLEDKECWVRVLLHRYSVRYLPRYFQIIIYILVCHVYDDMREAGVLGVDEEESMDHGSQGGQGVIVSYSTVEFDDVGLAWYVSYIRVVEQHVVWSL